MAEGDAVLDVTTEEFKTAAETYMKGTGLHKTMESERDARKALELKMKQFDGIDVDEVKKVMAEKAKAADEKSRAAGDFEKLLKQQGEKFTKELEERDTTNKGLHGDLEEALIDSAAMKAISKFEGDAELLLPHVKAATKLIEVNGKQVAVVVDESGEPRLAPDAKKATDYMSIEHLVGGWKEDGKFAGAFTGTGASGGGASASTRTGGAGTPKQFSTKEVERMSEAEFNKVVEAGARFTN